MTRDGDASRADWESVSADPDLEDDLGYRLAEMDVIDAGHDSPKLLFLPWEEEMVREASFIVADERVVVNLIDTR